MTEYSGCVSYLIGCWAMVRGLWFGLRTEVDRGAVSVQSSREGLYTETPPRSLRQQRRSLPHRVSLLGLTARPIRGAGSSYSRSMQTDTHTTAHTLAYIFKDFRWVLLSAFLSFRINLWGKMLLKNVGFLPKHAHTVHVQNFIHNWL